MINASVLRYRGCTAQPSLQAKFELTPTPLKLPEYECCGEQCAEIMLVLERGSRVWRIALENCINTLDDNLPPEILLAVSDGLYDRAAALLDQACKRLVFISDIVGDSSPANAPKMQGLFQIFAVFSEKPIAGEEPPDPEDVWVTGAEVLPVEASQYKDLINAIGDEVLARDVE